MIDALRKKYEADIAHAKANIEEYLHNPEDKLEVLNKHYGSL